MSEYKCYVANKPNHSLTLEKRKIIESETLITIKIKYCGVCGSDLHISKGEWGNTFPQVLGHEVVGEITSMPNHIESKLKIGDIVGVGWQNGACKECNHCKTDKEYFCNEATFTSFLNNSSGGFAEYIQVDPSFVFKIPNMGEDYPLASIAPLMCGGITAFKPLYNNFGTYNSLAIIGMGGIGNMAIKFGKTMFDEVHVVSNTESKKDKALELGATSFNLWPLKESPKYDLALVTSSHKIDINNLVNSMNKGGKIIILGVSLEEYDLNTETIVNNEIIIEGTNTGSPTTMRTMLHWVKKYNLQFPVQVEPFDNINEVLEKMDSNSHKNRIVLEIHDEKVDLQDNNYESEESEKYYAANSEEYGEYLISKISCEAGGLFTTYDSLFTKELTQHSLYDSHRGLNVIDTDTSKARIPFYLSHSNDPNLILRFPENKIYALKNISVGDTLSIDYRHSEPSLYKQFGSLHNKQQWIHGHSESISNEGSEALRYKYDPEDNIFSYNNINYQNNTLHYYGKNIKNIINMFDPNTPLFIYSKASIQSNINRVNHFLHKHFSKYKLHFSIKSNSTPHILSEPRHRGLNHLDACSPNEVFRALSCGYNPENIQYTSSYLSDLDYEQLNRMKGLKINADSFTMIEKLEHKNIGLRINPMAGMSYNCQANLQCTFGGKEPSKMGIVLDDVDKACKIAKENGKTIERLHCHAGNSYLSDDIDQEFANILNTINSAIEICKENGFTIKEINLGGGYGVPYTKEDKPFDWDKWANLVKSVIDTSNLCLSIEPGDYIMKASGMIIARVNAVETKVNTTFVGLNVGMNLNALPAYYGILSLPVPIIEKEGNMKVNVVGNINESIDVWAKKIEITTVEPGDYIALLNSGGYAESCSSVHSIRTDYNTILI